jgi:hypothetical protein
VPGAAHAFRLRTPIPQIFERKMQKNLKKRLDKAQSICYNMRCEYDWGIAKR